MTQFSKDGTAYEWFGDLDKPVVVLIHGLGLNRQIWKEFTLILSKQFRVLEFDLFSHGESPAPVRTPDLALYAEQIKILMDEFKVDRAALVGFSLGGMINRRFAMDYPDRVSALGILNSPHERGDEQQQLVEQRAIDSAAGGPGATLDETIKRWFTADFLEKNQGYITQVREWVLANDPKLYAECRFVLANGVVELIRPEPPITVATLVMTCEYDSGSNPAMSYAIGSEIEGSEVIIVPELQHMGLAERADLFLEPLTRFLNSID